MPGSALWGPFAACRRPLDASRALCGALVWYTASKRGACRCQPTNHFLLNMTQFDEALQLVTKVVQCFLLSRNFDAGTAREERQ